MWIIIVEMLISWLVGLVLALYIHEIGHLCVGLLNGWRFFTLSIGPMKLYRERMDEKIKLGFEENILNWCGVCATVPEEANDENIKIWARILIGGPIFSIVAGVFFLFMFFFYKKLFILMFGLDSLAIGLINIVPSSLRTGFFYNDGKRYKRIKNGGIAAKEEQEIMHIVEKAVVEGEEMQIKEEECMTLMNSEDYMYKYYAYYVMYTSFEKRDKVLAQKYCKLARSIDEKIPTSVKKMFLIGSE